MLDLFFPPKPPEAKPTTVHLTPEEEAQIEFKVVRSNKKSDIPLSERRKISDAKYKAKKKVLGDNLEWSGEAGGSGQSPGTSESARKLAVEGMP